MVDYAVYLSYLVLFVTSSCVSDVEVAAYLEENSWSVFAEKFGYEVGSQSLDREVSSRCRRLWI